MFNDLIRQIKRLERGMEISVPIRSDQDGFIEKQCPSFECGFRYKVYSDDWPRPVAQSVAYCPSCRFEAPLDSWWTKEQIEHARRQGMNHINGLIGDSLRNSARNFNRSRSNSEFISMSMQVRASPGGGTIMPMLPSENWEQKIRCEDCESNFSVIGSAFFCPCCGHNSAVRSFGDALNKVSIKISFVHDEKSRNNRENRDATEIFYRSVVETCLSDCVVAFQRVAERLYQEFVGGEKLPNNVFQRIEDGSKLWSAAVEEGYEDWLDDSEMTDFRVLIHRRHLLQHTDGIVDKRYLRQSGDESYRLGQRIVVNETDVTRLQGLVAKLVDEMKAKTLSDTPAAE